MNRGLLRCSIPSSAILLCFLSLVQASIAQDASAVDGGVRTISGIVDEVHASETPAIIMVRSRLGTKEEVVIGAVVKKGATIVRGKQRIALNHIRAGERVTLTYVKHREGLTVRSIFVHSR